MTTTLDRETTGLAGLVGLGELGELDGLDGSDGSDGSDELVGPVDGASMFEIAGAAQTATCGAVEALHVFAVAGRTSAVGYCADGCVADGCAADGWAADGWAADGWAADGCAADGCIADGCAADDCSADADGAKRQLSAPSAGAMTVGLGIEGGAAGTAAVGVPTSDLGAMCGQLLRLRALSEAAAAAIVLEAVQRGVVAESASVDVAGWVREQAWDAGIGLTPAVAAAFKAVTEQARRPRGGTRADLRPLAAAVLAGQVPIASAKTLGRELDLLAQHIPADVWQTAATELIDWAAEGASPADLRTARQRIAATYGTESFEKEQTTAKRHRELSRWVADDAGGWRAVLRTDNEGRAILDAAFDALAAPSAEVAATIAGRPTLAAALAFTAGMPMGPAASGYAAASGHPAASGHAAVSGDVAASGHAADQGGAFTAETRAACDADVSADRQGGAQGRDDAPAGRQGSAGAYAGAGAGTPYGTTRDETAMETARADVRAALISAGWITDTPDSADAPRVVDTSNTHQTDAGRSYAQAQRRASSHAAKTDAALSGVEKEDADQAGAAKADAEVLALGRDDRTPGQRRHDALVEMARVLAPNPATLGDVRPASAVKAQVTVTMEYEKLRARLGAGFDGHGTPLTGATVRRLCCAASLIPAVLDGDGAVLDWGRARRLASPDQLRYLWHRDKGCSYPGCGRPPAWTEAHHLDEWIADNGPTTVDNLSLLCARHHDIVHTHHLKGDLVNGHIHWTRRPSTDPSA